MGSVLPAIIGFVLCATTTGPGDQKMGAAMVFYFIFFPLSFLLGLVSAAVTWAKWRKWRQVDRVVGLAPLVLYLAFFLFGLCATLLWG